MKVKKQLFLFIGMLFLFSGSAWAEAPLLLGHQGRALDRNSKPLSGVITVKFKMYTASATGSEFWSETHSLTFQNGYYRVSLGSGTPIQLATVSKKEIWLGVTVGIGGAELKPRQRLYSVPFAVMARYAAQLKGGAVLDAKSVKIGGTVVINDKGEWVGAKSGLQGAKGDRGDKGDKGDKGVDGKIGAKGDRGDKGDKGDKGVKGDKGDKGAVGAQGPPCTVSKTSTDSAGNAVISFKCGSTTTNATLNLIPAGTIVAYGGTIIPPGWLLCDGRLISQTTYRRLFTAIGYAHGRGSGSFRLPDYRGRFLRGVARGHARAPDRNSRTAAATGGNTGDRVGSVQSWSTGRPRNRAFTTNTAGNHTHNVTDRANWDCRNTPQHVDTSCGEGGLRNTYTNTTSASGNHSHSVAGGGDNETRPENANVYYIIKF